MRQAKPGGPARPNSPTEIKRGGASTATMVDDQAGAQVATTSSRSSTRLDFVVIGLLIVWVVATRCLYVADFAFMGKDGPLYIHSLALDPTYNVPMPGNLGVVLLGKAASLVWVNPLHAYEAVNISLTIVGVAFAYLFAALFVPRALAAASAFALSANPMVWWYGDVIASYLVWLAVLPTLGWFGIRYVRGRSLGDLLGASITLGLGMVLRPDLLFFGTPFWLGCLWFGRAPWKSWLVGMSILTVGCACWFFGTAAVLGGVDTYLERVHAKHTNDLEGYSLVRRGLIEGLLRNGSKYILFLAWGAPLVVIPFLWGALHALMKMPQVWREWILALLWVGPSWYFAFFVFAGTGGLIFPCLPLFYLGAAHGLRYMCGGGSLRRPVTAMALLGLVSAAQFLATPLLRESNQRHVILNVMFLRYSRAGLLARYNYNLDDFGVSPSLSSVLRQMKHPESIPKLPPPNAPDRFPEPSNAGLTRIHAN